MGRFDDMRSRDQGLVTMTCNGIGGVHLRIEQRDRSRMAYAVFNPESGGGLGGSPETHRALLALMAAMARDNAEKPKQGHFSENC